MWQLAATSKVDGVDGTMQRIVRVVSKSKGGGEGSLWCLWWFKCKYREHGAKPDSLNLVEDWLPGCYWWTEGRAERTFKGSKGDQVRTGQKQREGGDADADANANAEFVLQGPRSSRSYGIGTGNLAWLE